jgi:hypothetical protein
MLPAWITPDLLAVCLFGAVVPLLGLGGLLVRPSAAWQRRALAAAAVVLGGLGAAAAAGGQARGAWPAAALLVGTCGAFLALGSPRLGRAGAWLLGLLRRPGLPWAVLTAVGPALAVGWFVSLDAVVPPWEPGPGYDSAHRSVPLEPVDLPRAFTDAGRPLRLYRPTAAAVLEEARAAEAYVFEAWELGERVIRTAPASPDCDCHGWVFADGRYWVLGEDVPAILRDNGYAVVDDPRPGDLIVYRAGDGEGVCHSGIVRAVVPGGPVLVESKLGKAGRFIHAPDVARYGSNYAYYRSPRAGHGPRWSTEPGPPAPVPPG